MFEFFKKKKMPEVIAEHPFYSQYIELTEDQLTVVEHDNDFKKLDLKTITWISIYNWEKTLSGHPNCWINFGSLDVFNISVCTVAGNFEKLEAYILNLPDFDRETYFKIKNSTLEFEETTLLKVSQLDNYSLSPEEEYQRLPLDEGIFIENKKALLPWVDYEDLQFADMRAEDVVYPNPSYRGKRYHISDVTLFNGLTAAAIETEAYPEVGHAKLNRPILMYRVEIIAQQIATSFYALGSHLDAYFNAKGTVDKDTNNNLTYSYKEGLCSLKLSAFWNDRTEDYSNPMYLEVSKEPDLDRFYSSAVLEQLALADLSYLTIPLYVGTSATYLTVDNIFYTPKHFQIKEGETLFWRHKTERMSGISNAEMTVIFLDNSVTLLSLVVENCRGHEGGNYIEVYNHSTLLTKSIFVSDTHEFKKYLPSIGELWGVAFNWSTFDNHY